MKTRTRVAIAIGALLAGTALLAAPALAHVTVNPNEAPKGGFAKLSFRVPNERDDAGTTKLEIVFPDDNPIPSVSVRPHQGWTYDIEMAEPATPVEAHGEPVGEVVTKITWEGGPINPGEFDEFDVSVGPLPDADQLIFKALQTYESGEVVRWIDEPTADGAELEHPAPILTLTDSDSTDHAADSGDAAGEPQADDNASVSAEPISETSDETGLAVAGIIIGTLGLLAGGGAVLRSRR